MMQEILKRIEAEAKAFEDKNPYDALHSAYYMGAKSERNKTIDEVIEKIQHRVTSGDWPMHWITIKEIIASLKVDL